MAYEHAEIQGKRAFTLTGLRDRLNDIIAENEKSGRGSRNHAPVLIRLERRRQRGGSVSRYFAPEFMSSSLLGMFAGNVMALEVTEGAVHDEIVKG